jgi:hypothetical protein
MRWQVPEGKELIRPEAGFVVKTHKLLKGGEKEKLFVNLVQSPSIGPPTRKAVS